MKPFSIWYTLLKPQIPDKDALYIISQMQLRISHFSTDRNILHALQNKNYRGVKMVTNFPVMSPVCNLTTHTRYRYNDKILTP